MIEREDIDGVTVFRVSGDLRSTEDLRPLAEIAHELPQKVVFNFAGTGWMSSSHFGTVIETQTALERAGAKTAFVIVFERPDGIMDRHVLEMLPWHIFKTEAEAIEYVRQDDD